MGVETKTKPRPRAAQPVQMSAPGRADPLSDPLTGGGGRRGAVQANSYNSPGVGLDRGTGDRAEPGMWGHDPETWLVVKGYQAKVNAIRGLAGNIGILAGSLENIGSGKDLLVATRNLLQTTEDLFQAADTFQAFCENQVDLSGVNELTSKAKQVMESMEAVAALADDEAMKAYIADMENMGKARDWALQAADTFKAASVAVPGGIPLVSDYLKGCLDAPAVYVRVMISIFQKRFRDVEQGDPSRAKQKWTADGNPLFEGPMSYVAVHASIGPRGLWDFMKENKNRDGINLERVSRDVGMAHLSGLVARYAEAEADLTKAEVNRWLSWLYNFNYDP